ncbi:MAG TPA: OmpA family protein [Firmicutes bacterium]|jgi:chemotaxis protein MotB|nr:OmpA family protein [Bacillota bacterium]
MKKRERKKESKEIGAPGWMVTYGDMTTLLLTFFILLFTFSSIDVKRFQEVMSAVQHSFMGRTGILMGSTGIEGEEGKRLDNLEASSPDELASALAEQQATMLEMMAQLEETYEEVKSFLRKAGLEDDIQLRLEDRGIVMELPEHILFDSGEAVIKDDFYPTFDLLSELLAGLPNQIFIEGHTDDVPIKTYLYPSNWELSVARAVSVARYLVDVHDLPPRRFVATGYGEYHPLDTNETPEGRARNRRVSIVISIVTF